MKAREAFVMGMLVGERGSFGGEQLRLPMSAVTQKVSFLGTSGSGKTYGAGVFVEGLIAGGAQVIIIDTVGNWWGLRVASDGKRPGIKIPVIGGDRGDLPLLPEHGAEIARTIAGTKSSMIVDVSDFEDGELRRFVIAFAKTLLASKKKRPSPVMVVWEECQDIIPQTMFGDDAKMVGAVQRLIKRGRNYGVGTALISQRSAAVNKGCLNQCMTMFAFRTGAPLDIKAVTDWVNAVGDARRSELLAKLPELETGEAIIYSPQWLKIVGKVAIATKRTFNASKEPDFDDDTMSQELAPIDLGELKEKLDQVVREATENDVDALKKEIASLRAIKANTTDDDRVADLERAVRVARDGLAERDRQIAALTAERDARRGAYAALAASMIRINEEVEAASTQITQHDQNMFTHWVDHETTIGKRRREQIQPPVETPTSTSTSGASLPKAQANVLEALAWFAAIGIKTPSATAVAFMAGYSNSGHFTNTKGKLRTRGYISYPSGGTMVLTDAGRRVAPKSSQPRTLQALHDAIRKRLKPPFLKLLNPLLEAYPRSLSNEQLVKKSGFSESGHYTNMRGRLSSMGLITYPDRDMVRASDILFPEGLR